MLSSSFGSNFSQQHDTRQRQAAEAVSQHRKEAQPRTSEPLHMPVIAHCSLDMLPNEIMLRVLQSLPLRDIGQMAKTCTRFSKLCRDPSLYPSIELTDRQLSERALLAIGARKPRRLVLRRCHIDESSHLRAALSQAAPRLQELSLEGCNGVTDTVVRGLCRLCHSLRSLDLTWCNVSNKALQWLAKASLTKLHTLRLSSCAFVGDRGLSALVAARGPQLRRLDLSGCIAVTSGGIDSLALCCPNLEELHIAHLLKVGGWGQGLRGRGQSQRHNKAPRAPARES